MSMSSTNRGRQPVHQGTERGNVSCLHFDYEGVKVATKGFNKSNKLGEGGFGPVFRGELLSTDVAIKVLRRTKPGDKGASDLADEQFDAEIQILSKFRHPNLVTLLGYSNDPGLPRCLIYEFMVNGTLEDALDFGVDRSKVEGSETIGLPWMVRISIAIDTARGLRYLHEAIKESPLVHRDIKSANVLLDLSFRAKVGDFGLVRAIGHQPASHGIRQSQTARIVGTSGYIAPEYYRGVITTKLDTYAFGVVLLEILTGLPSYDPKRNQEYSDLVTFIETMTRRKDFLLVQYVDGLAGDWPSRSFFKLFSIAQRCLTESHFDRPGMNEIYVLLEELSLLSGQLFAEENKTKKKT
ncbi:PREDICTED: interleukin-1 receptor-associated kinase 4-like [Amphimedon queenslandica]|uniref:non-specific serine/threonine protein kinase n=2 Tax=Amphimedon queenslandica TaxID=400682 RepID=A0AAN0JFG2_AMPQE|nr:PREDICTED: interleukin-1 receptor-associated kinase 4-like [Amphimedon queenslandica]|eukprot:XP_019855709.1 PREDICTED: interleukin-1 receptor-associated kinase 4-like [Amphimedon queenslandica]